MALYSELKRRNIFRVAIAYLALGWLLLEIGTLGVDFLALPRWIWRFGFALWLICFPLALVFSWIYELTPHGLRRESEVARGESITPQTGRRLLRLAGAAVIGVFLINLARLVFE